jgi:histidinol dehydrogenase
MELLKTNDVKFTTKFQLFVNERREATVDVSGTVRDIIHDVRIRGDVAVKDYTTRFNRFSPDILRLGSEFIAKLQ